VGRGGRKNRRGRGLRPWLRFYLALAALALATGCATPPGSYDLVPTPSPVVTGQFFSPQTDDAPPIWGIRGGIAVGIFPAVVGFGRAERGGPRGLLRFGYEEDGRVYFINFAALTPVTIEDVHGKSELDRSPNDGRPGIIIEAYPYAFHGEVEAWVDRAPPGLSQVGKVVHTSGGDQLIWVLRYEEFGGGARVYVVVTIDRERPREAAFSFFTEPGSAELKGCVLSPTFGNLTRLRELELVDGTVSVEDLWPGFSGRGFARPRFFKRSELPRDELGGLRLTAWPDEREPWKQGGYPHPARLAQYLRLPAGEDDATVRGMVNARRYFWKTTTSVPGGPAFENIALVQRFREGQRLIYGFAPR
jgi:hypothetical protein